MAYLLGVYALSWYFLVLWRKAKTAWDGLCPIKEVKPIQNFFCGLFSGFSSQTFLTDPRVGGRAVSSEHPHKLHPKYAIK